MANQWASRDSSLEKRGRTMKASGGRCIAIMMMCGICIAAAPVAKPHSPTTRPTTARSPRAWPPLSDEQRKAAIEENKKRASDLLDRTGLTAAPYETDYFLFVSNLPRSEAAKWARLLDQYYGRLAALFAVPKGENLWRGMAIIVVFAQRSEYETFEDKAFHNLEF